MFWKRSVLDESKAKSVATALQQVLVDLLDLSLQTKQAHWNLHGPQFLSVHEKLDEVYDTAREAADEVAERITQLGFAADGRSKTVAAKSRLEAYPDDFVPSSRCITLIADRLHAVAKSLRDGADAVEDDDPLTEDMLVGLGEGIEKHLWMFQALEKGT